MEDDFLIYKKVFWKSPRHIGKRENQDSKNIPKVEENKYLKRYPEVFDGRKHI